MVNNKRKTQRKYGNRKNNEIGTGDLQKNTVI